MLTWIKGWFAEPNHSNSKRLDSNRTVHQRLRTPKLQLNTTVDSAPEPEVTRKAEVIGEPQVISMRLKLPASPGTKSPTPAPSKSQLTSKKKISKNKVLLANLKFASKTQLEQLNHAGIVTAGDLARCDPQTLVQQQQLPARSLGWLRKKRRALRLFVKIKPLAYFEADLLLAVHRSSVERMAGENPIHLFRDIQRYVLSTRGCLLLRENPLPTQSRVQAWVDAAKRSHAITHEKSCKRKTAHPLGTEPPMP